MIYARGSNNRSRLMIATRIKNLFLKCTEIKRIQIQPFFEIQEKREHSNLLNKYSLKQMYQELKFMSNNFFKVGDFFYPFDEIHKIIAILRIFQFYILQQMLEETKILPKQCSKWHPQKVILINMNEQVIKLIKEKLIPLNKNRYGHLQKINNAISKGHSYRYSSEANIISHLEDGTQNINAPNIKMKISKRSQHQMAAADLLINRLKNLKDLQLNNPIMAKNEEAGRCWQTLRHSILQPQQIKDLVKQPEFLDKDGYKSSRSRKKRQNLIQLAERAEKYLRLKKHQLKEQYRQQQQERYGIRNLQTSHSDIEHLLSKLKKPIKLIKQQQNSKISKLGTDEQLKKQILQDIRESMFEQKINRIKRDINHKKIVQMR